MKPKTYILYMLLMPSVAFAQKYSLGDLSVAGDKVMLSLVGDDIFNHSQFDMNAAYSYTDKSGEETWAYVRDHSSIKYKPKKIIVQYAVDYPYAKCPIQNHVSGRVTLEFNDKLELINKPDIGFIPGYMIANEKCNYLTRDEAIAIIKKEKFAGKEMPDIRHNEGGSTFNGKPQLAWSFSYITYQQVTVIEEDGTSSKREEPENHFVSVDATTGKIITDVTFPKVNIEDVIDRREKQDREKKK